MFLFIAEIFIAQIVVITIIVFILKIILDKQLIESAVRQFEIINPSRVDKDLTEIAVITYSALNSNLQKRIANAVYKKINKTVNPIYPIDKKIKGGNIIKFKQTIIDHSLLSRLKESGMIR